MELSPQPSPAKLLTLQPSITMTLWMKRHFVAELKVPTFAGGTPLQSLQVISYSLNLQIYWQILAQPQFDYKLELLNV
jgi:hypothetical protein